MKNSELLKKAMKKGFSIGYVDIETSPKLGWYYGDSYNICIPDDQVEVITQITSISYMDITNKGELITKEWNRPTTTDKIFCDNTKDDMLLKNVIPELVKFDLLIGQNSIRFDVPKLNGRAWLLGLPPIKNYLSLDTLLESRKTMSLDSHKLDSMCSRKGFGKKIRQDMKDAIAVAKGDRVKTKGRLRYNARDVRIGVKLAFSQLDYYSLQKKLINLLKLYINTEDPTFCIRCAAEKQARFNVTKKRIKDGGYKFTCDSCDYQWGTRK